MKHNQQTNSERNALATDRCPAPSTTPNSRIKSSAVLQSQASLRGPQQPQTLPYGTFAADAGKQSNANHIGGVPIPPMAAGTPTSLRIEAAAQYAAGAAVPYNGNTSKRDATAATFGSDNGDYQVQKKHKVAEKAKALNTATTMLSGPTKKKSHPMIQTAPAPQISMGDFPDSQTNVDKTLTSTAPSAAVASTALSQKQQTNRDRNREHARSTRLRKKAYVNKLKELLDALHVERSDDDRKRRVAVQKLAEIQDLRRKVVYTFFGYHAKCEKNVTKWRMILEDDFWLKQPVTPYRSFRRCEIEKVCAYCS